MLESEIIEKYFKKLNLFGYRYCKLTKYYRLTTKGQLQYKKYYRGISLGWCISTWKDFNKYLKYLKNEEEIEFNYNKQKAIDNDVNNFNWEGL
jgi:hypothetical protein